MSQQQVMLRGESRRRQILVCALIAALGLLILHLWSPGTIPSILSGALRVISHLYGYLGDILDSLRELVHDISNWYH